MFQSILQETLAEENWQEVQKLGGRKIPALFPLGVIEEHGPHLPLHLFSASADHETGSVRNI